mmetsp:Transcript_71988/g.198645  ORF Transcript_71988/g.198645 Transcript_71988/m.198645 type:complete len:298 (+) Transcript_71988:909-1802(+)
MARRGELAGWQGRNLRQHLPMGRAQPLRRVQVAPEVGAVHGGPPREAGGGHRQGHGPEPAAHGALLQCQREDMGIARHAAGLVPAPCDVLPRTRGHAGVAWHAVCDAAQAPPHDGPREGGGFRAGPHRTRRRRCRTWAGRCHGSPGWRAACARWPPCQVAERRAPGQELRGASGQRAPAAGGGRCPALVGVGRRPAPLAGLPELGGHTLWPAHGDTRQPQPPGLWPGSAWRGAPLAADGGRVHAGRAAWPPPPHPFRAGPHPDTVLGGVGAGPERSRRGGPHAPPREAPTLGAGDAA